MWKRWFWITQGDSDTVQEKDIHAVLPCLVLRRGVYGFEKDRCSLVLDWLISFTLYGLFVYWWTWHRYCKFEKVKVQNSVGLKYKFYMTILKVSSFCRGNKIGQQVYLWRKEQQGGTRSHHHYFVTWLFWQILIS